MNIATPSAYGWSGPSTTAFTPALGMRPPLQIQDVVLHHLRTEDEIADIVHLRDEIDLSVHTAAGRQFEILEKKRDECGFVFGFELGGEWIGTIRIVPLGWQLTLTETLTPEAGPGMPEMVAGDWEVGRLVLAPEFRSDVEALRHCLRIALEYACNATKVEHLYATCTHVLSRLYRRFGFSVCARDVLLPGTSKTYTLIRGASEAVAAGLASRSGTPTQ